MRIGAVFTVLTHLSIPLFAIGTTVNKFQGGNTEANADLSGTDHSDVVNITIPVECFVLNATMNITSVAAQGAYPVAPEVLLNNTMIWAFNGTGYGALGRQDLFSDGTTQMRAQFGEAGGMNGTAIRLPKGAVVQNATMDVSMSRPMIGMNDHRLKPVVVHHQCHFHRPPEMRHNLGGERDKGPRQDNDSGNGYEVRHGPDQRPVPGG